MLVNNLTATQSAKVNTAQEGLINICGLHSLLSAFHSKVLGGETEPPHQKKNPAKKSVSDGGWESLKWIPMWRLWCIHECFYIASSNGNQMEESCHCGSKQDDLSLECSEFIWLRRPSLSFYSFTSCFAVRRIAEDRCPCSENKPEDWPCLCRHHQGGRRQSSSSRTIHFECGFLMKLSQVAAPCPARCCCFHEPQTPQCNFIPIHPTITGN